MDIDKTAEKKEKYLPALLILFVTVFSWGKILLAGFINDDYQIIGFHSANALSNIFSPFWQRDISSVYWRPLGNMIHPLILYFSGFNPLAFRAVSLLLYFFCCYTFYRLLRRSGISFKGALFSALLFTAAPSHELQAAWIADQGESLVTALLMLSFINYTAYNVPAGNIKPKPIYGILSLVFFMLALLVKESSFSGVLIPFIYLLLSGRYSKTDISRAALHAFAGMLLLSGVLLYRYLVVGGSPFSSGHFSHGAGPAGYLVNFFIYIPLAVLPPEALEWLLHFVMYNKPASAFLVLLIILLLSVFVFRLRRSGKPVRGMYENIKPMLPAFFWFIVFILPALPAMMRWYAFTASAGIFWFLAVVCDRYTTGRDKGDRRTYALYSFIAAAVIALSVYNSGIMDRWVENSRRLDRAIASIRKISGEIRSDTVYVWGIPDKFSRVPVMKLGINETFWYAAGHKDFEVLGIVRSEFMEDDARIDASLNKRSTGTQLILSSKGGRLLAEGERSSYVIEEGSETYENEKAVYTIETRLNSRVSSKCTVRNFGEFSSKANLYFNGSEFKKIED